MKTIETRLQSVRQRISSAEQQYDRKPGSVSLLAISKNKSSQDIQVSVQADQHNFGESYLQEALPKIQALSELDIEWHYIGPIQSNKTRLIAENFSWVHSIDRVKIAERLNDQRSEPLAPLNICLQINISHEQTKSGTDTDYLLELANRVHQLPRLRLRGLMAIPAPSNDIKQQRKVFREVREAQQQLIEHGFPLDTLSMGMSQDFEAAIAEGATIVRIGTAIFGDRT